jgi:hypothetical protein
VLVFHRVASAGDPALVGLLADVRRELVDRQALLFRSAGAADVRVVEDWPADASFGEVLAALAPRRGGLVVLGSGGVVRLVQRDATRLVEVAASGDSLALTNNRYSSDVCAVGDARALRRLPALPSDNALPRWLEERAGFDVAELPGRERLALDLDTPLDVALAALAPGAPAWLRRRTADARLEVPRLAELRELAADPLRELLVFGRSGSTTLRWLERNVRCRVRFLAEERGLRAATPLAIAGAGRRVPSRAPVATLGTLLEPGGPGSLAEVVALLGDGAVLDTRVLLAHRLGPDESAWPPPADRFASDLLRADEVGDAWLRDMTTAAAASRGPILLGAHSLVGPGIPLLLRGAAGQASRAGAATTAAEARAR